MKTDWMVCRSAARPSGGLSIMSPAASGGISDAHRCGQTRHAPLHIHSDTSDDVKDREKERVENGKESERERERQRE